VNPQRLQAWLLRVAGAVEILAFFAVVMPRSWMEVSHSWLGLGNMPGGPIIMFMIRQSSYTYGMHTSGCAFFGAALLLLNREGSDFYELHSAEN